MKSIDLETFESQLYKDYQAAIKDIYGRMTWAFMFSSKRESTVQEYIKELHGHLDAYLLMMKEPNRASVKKAIPKVIDEIITSAILLKIMVKRDTKKASRRS